MCFYIKENYTLEEISYRYTLHVLSCDKDNYTLEDVFDISMLIQQIIQKQPSIVKFITDHANGLSINVNYTTYTVFITIGE